MKDADAALSDLADLQALEAIGDRSLDEQREIEILRKRVIWHCFTGDMESRGLSENRIEVIRRAFEIVHSRAVVLDDRNDEPRSNCLRAEVPNAVRKVRIARARAAAARIRNLDFVQD